MAASLSWAVCLWQSVPSFIAASNHVNAGIPLIKEENQYQKTAA
jgi:hypothetical protein